MHKTIDLLAILDIHKNLVPNCGMWDDTHGSQYIIFAFHCIVKHALIC